MAGGSMKRRTFITLIGGAAASPLVGRVQQPAKMKRLAMLHLTTKPEDLSIGGDPDYTIIFEDIKRRGYIEGVNLTVDRYSSPIAQAVVIDFPDGVFSQPPWNVGARLMWAQEGSARTACGAGSTQRSWP
jgi:hypothetical protein